MNNRNISIYLITVSFPFGKSEPFIHEELDILQSKYKNITILPLNYARGQRDLPSNVKLDLSICFKPSFKSLSSVMYAFLHKNLWKEIIKRPLIISNKDSVKRLINHFIRYINVKRWLSRLKYDNFTAFYTYWITGATEAIGKFKHKGSKLITRCHSYDLYEERGFIVRQYESIKNADVICPISKHGYNYLTSLYPGLQKKIILSRLGVKKINNLKNIENKPHVPLIVSCSYILPVKRIDRIVEVFTILGKKKLRIKWIHFGGGPHEKVIKDLADKKLKNSTIDYSFRGNVDNNIIIQFYENNFIDLFINTSDIEGIPVSIMEALGAGIPVIAPDIGGIKELINHKNGYILPPGSKGPYIAEVIEKILFGTDIKNMRLSAKKTWENFCDSELNYNEFCSRIYRCFYE